MKEYQGLKFTEISETLKVPINTAKSRMYYGLSALKKSLTAGTSARPWCVMSCDITQQQLIDYLYDEDMRPDERDRLKTHIEACPSCSQALEETGTTSRILNPQVEKPHETQLQEMDGLVDHPNLDGHDLDHPSR